MMGAAQSLLVFSTVAIYWTIVADVRSNVMTLSTNPFSTGKDYDNRHAAYREF